jgi:hypothetical protein
MLGGKMPANVSRDEAERPKKAQKVRGTARNLHGCRNTALRYHTKLPRLQLLMIISTVESGPRRVRSFLCSGNFNSIETGF